MVAVVPWEHVVCVVLSNAIVLALILLGPRGGTQQ